MRSAALTILFFALRHFIFVAAVTIAGCLAWTILYFALLIYAMITDGGIGSPLTYPMGLLAIALPCLVIGWGLFAPSCGVGLFVCEIFRWPRLAAIPFVVIAAALGVYVLQWAWVEFATTHPMNSLGDVARAFAIYLAIPLGIYWWINEGPVAIFDTVKRLRAEAVQRREASGAIEPSQQPLI
jgi:hypothetical protein